MKDFLNRYMAANSAFKLQDRATLKECFKNTTEVILEGLGEKAFRLKAAVNAALFDSLMVGIADRINKRPINDFNLL